MAVRFIIRLFHCSGIILEQSRCFLVHGLGFVGFCNELRAGDRRIRNDSGQLVVFFSSGCLETWMASKGRRHFMWAESRKEALKERDDGKGGWKKNLNGSDIHVDSGAYACALRRCGNAKALLEGRRLHALLIEGGHARDRYLGNFLVEMYGKCGALEDARAVFAKIHRPNVFSWTIMMSVYAQHGLFKEALELFQRMQLEGAVPNKVTFISVLFVCASPQALDEGRRIHAHIVARGLELDVVVGTALVNMYGKCGSIEDARRTFARMPQRDVVLWSAMIAVCAQDGLGKEAFQFFEQMQLEGLIPDKLTFVNVLSACANGACLAEGREIHACIVASGSVSAVEVGNALINMYGICGKLGDARWTFDKMAERDCVSWNVMMTTYVQHGHGKVALQLFQQMQSEGLIPNKVTFSIVLSACASQSALAEGKGLHAYIVKSGYALDVTVCNAIVKMYGSCGSLKDARRMFDGMPKRDVVSWNVMMAGYAQHGHGTEALQLFKQMEFEGVVPSTITFAHILSACASQAALVEGMQVHANIVASGFDLVVVVGNALVNMYGKCGSLEDAWMVFDRMPVRDVVSWNAIIASCAQHGYSKEAICFFQQMQLEGVMPNKVTFASIFSACASQAALAEGKQFHGCIVGSGFEPDVVVGNALVNMYGKCGALDDARRTFNKLPERDVITWNAMIAAYTQHLHGMEALQLFWQMELEGVIPDRATFVSILSACASQAAIAEGKRVHALIVDSGFELDVVIGNALVNMYAKCGNLEDAWRIFNKMPKQDVVSWTAMIAACSQHGLGKEALKLFQQMQLEAVIPNEVTFVSILSACSHTGMVDEGCHYFISMKCDHGIEPTLDHYNCMIDLLGRAGQLDAGEDLINKMPCKPSAMSWLTLLSACRMHFDVARGKHAAKHVFELDPDNASPYVLLSSIYAAAGKWVDAAGVIKVMNEKGLK